MHWGQNEVRIPGGETLCIGIQRYKDKISISINAHVYLKESDSDKGIFGSGIIGKGIDWIAFFE